MSLVSFPLDFIKQAFPYLENTMNFRAGASTRILKGLVTIMI